MNTNVYENNQSDSDSEIECEYDCLTCQLRGKIIERMDALYIIKDLLSDDQYINLSNHLKNQYDETMNESSEDE